MRLHGYFQGMIQPAAGASGAVNRASTRFANPPMLWHPEDPYSVEGIKPVAFPTLTEALEWGGGASDACRSAPGNSLMIAFRIIWPICKSVLPDFRVEFSYTG